MNAKLPLLLALLVTSLLLGCIEFKRQTLSYRHDTATDTLYLFQDYQGIYGSEDPAWLTEEERSQLNSVLNGERTFFFNNWITEYNRDRLLEIKRTAQGELDPNADYEKAIRTLADLALANVNVENVGFYMNTEKQLCGTQKVTVRNVSKVLASLNQVLHFVLREEAAKEEKSAEEQRLLRAFADRGDTVLRLQGNRLEIRVPLREEDYLAFKDSEPQAVAWREAGGEMTHKEGVLALAIGSAEARTVSVNLPVFEKPYSDNAVREARKQGINEAFDPVAAAKAFLQ